MKRYTIGLILLFALMSTGCGDKEEKDKTETHTVSFKNINQDNKMVYITDDNGLEPLFSSITLQPGQLKSITYKCEDCPELKFMYSFSSNANGAPCVCEEGEADYNIGYCPISRGSSTGNVELGECKTCSKTTVATTTQYNPDCHK